MFVIVDPFPGHGFLKWSAISLTSCLFFFFNFHGIACVGLLFMCLFDLCVLWACGAVVATVHTSPTDGENALDDDFVALDIRTEEGKRK